MSDPEDTVAAIKTGLERYVRPRHEASYIRRVLALHLRSCFGSGPWPDSLSLLKASTQVDLDAFPLANGLHRDYLQAASSNIAARRRFDELLQQAQPSEEVLQSEQPLGSSAFLEGWLELLHLRQKRQILLAVQRSLNALLEKPAATENFLSPEQVFASSKPVPAVPETVINGLVVEQSALQPSLGSRAIDLGKAVLKAGLLLKHQEGLLAAAKTRCGAELTGISNNEKLEALNSARNEAIAWIETELGKAPAQEPGDSTAPGQQEVHYSEEEADDGMNAQLSQIADKYSKYVDARRSLLALVSLPHPPPTTPARSSRQPADDVSCFGAEPGTDLGFLFTPYAEALLSISRRQKAEVAQRCHFKSVLNRQMEESDKALVHLEEESQLLPLYPAGDLPRPRCGLFDDLGADSAGRSGMTAHVQPWISAAESAKMGVLEAVADTMDKGQAALGNSMSSLERISRLLAGDMYGEAEASAGVDEEKACQSSDGSTTVDAAKRTGVGTHVEDDPWSRLHGTLDLIGHL